jgi:preprotein translocase subunit YajC
VNKFALLICQQPQGPGIFEFLLPFIVIFFIFWLFLIRPQRKQQKERLEMLSRLKRNDHVLTSGGIYGIIQSVRDNEVIIKIDEQNNVKVRVAKSAIISVEKSASDEIAPEETAKK